MKLPPLVQRRLAAGVLSAGHARALLGLPDVAAMERIAQRIVAEGLSVRATEELRYSASQAAPYAIGDSSCLIDTALRCVRYEGQGNPRSQEGADYD